MPTRGTGALAAVVMEPIQGYGGSVVYRDEILTGMGRTGRMFCVEHTGVVPDVIVFGKGTPAASP